MRNIQQSAAVFWTSEYAKTTGLFIFNNVKPASTHMNF
jgi:hypothetical protein